MPGNTGNMKNEEISHVNGGFSQACGKIPQLRRKQQNVNLCNMLLLQQQCSRQVWQGYGRNKRCRRIQRNIGLEMAKTRTTSFNGLIFKLFFLNNLSLMASTCNVLEVHFFHKLKISAAGVELQQYLFSLLGNNPRVLFYMVPIRK